MSASSWDDAVPTVASPVVIEASGRWSLTRRILFRFAFAYLALYVNPVMFEMVPFGPNVVGKYFEMWQKIVPIVGQALFGVRITVFTNGSGDTTYDYVLVLCLATLAAAITLVWSMLDRHRLNYARLYEWLCIYVRFSLGLTMMAYGAAKVIPTQFPAPSLDRLLQPIGDASPMGLLWTFMGASAAFSIFTGASEMLAGLLLTIRRTTLLGALLTIVVMGNIVVLNFCYDVPVKLFSMHLLLMAVFLVLPDLGRLLDTFFRHRPPDLFRSRPLRTALVALRTVLIACIAVMMLLNNYKAMKRVARSPLYGIWNVETFEGEATTRWRRVIFDNASVFAVQGMNDSRTRYGLTLNQKQQTMLLQDREKPGLRWTLTYRRPDPNSLVLDGSIGGRTIHAILRKTEIPPFRLKTRGFHWINEYPFNR